MVDFQGYLYYLNPVYFRNLEGIEEDPGKDGR